MLKLCAFSKSVVVCGFLAALSPCHATLLASDEFNYTLNANVGGQNGGSGFSGAWGYSSQVSGSVSTAKIIAGLTFSDLAVSGNAARENVISSSSGGFADRVYLKRHPGSVPVAGDEFWFRYLFRQPQSITASGFAGGMDIDDVENVSLYTKFGALGLTGAGNGRGGVNVDTTSVSAPVGSPSLSDAATYLIIGKFTGVNDAFGVARTGKFWALSEADYDAIKAGGITEAELNAQNRQTATETVSPTSSQPLNFTTADFFELRGVDAIAGNAFYLFDFDEVYAGTSLGDLGLPTAVPEPTTLTLLLVGLAVSWRMRRLS
ncbi:MAG: PEP-CTERM sorting domain-containing protein [Verrucomicrobia bacterium]|nr:MAG: PEP-CTERM sorting domain-containing protein [Verrucomicrobiota bacterium]